MNSTDDYVDKAIEVKDADQALRLTDRYRDKVEAFDHVELKLAYFQGSWIGCPWRLQGNYDPVAPALFVQRRLEMWTTTVVGARSVKNDSPSMADHAFDKSRRCHRISPCVTVVTVVTGAFGGREP